MAAAFMILKSSRLGRAYTTRHGQTRMRCTVSLLNIFFNSRQIAHQSNTHTSRSVPGSSLSALCLPTAVYSLHRPVPTSVHNHNTLCPPTTSILMSTALPTSPHSHTDKEPAKNIDRYYSKTVVLASTAGTVPACVITH